MGGYRKCINPEFINGWDHRFRRPSSRAEAAMLAVSLACYNLSTVSPKVSIIRTDPIILLGKKRNFFFYKVKKVQVDKFIRPVRKIGT